MNFGPKNVVDIRDFCQYGQRMKELCTTFARLFVKLKCCLIDVLRKHEMFECLLKKVVIFYKL